VASRWGASRKATLSLVEQLRPDLVHLNSMPLSSSACALLDQGVPFVWHVREPPPDQGLRTAAIRAIMRRTPHCVFITRYDRKQWVGDETGRIVYNCVPDDWFAARPPPMEEARPGRPVTFAYLGGASIPKGVETLLGALRLLDGGGVSWECVMPGFLPDPCHVGRERLVKRIARGLGYRNLGDRLLPKFLALGAAVRPLPFSRDIRSLLAEVDFVVFPALSPHFPRPIIEAAALGKPAVGTAVGGVDECIVPGKSGLLCEPGDARSLADALERLIRDPGLRRSLGVGAYERSVAIHSSSAQHRAVATLYGDVLAGRSVVPSGAE
jgi:glycosyltransferase involved in cell wall biosynthesis